MTSPLNIQLIIKKMEQGDIYLFIPKGLDGGPSSVEVPIRDSQKKRLPEWSKLESAYENWQYLYIREWKRCYPKYSLESSLEAEETVLSSDPADLSAVENNLINSFRSWLQHSKLQELWDSIRQAIQASPPTGRSPQGGLPVEVLINCECPPDDILHYLPWRSVDINLPQIRLVRTALSSPDKQPISLPDLPFRSGMKVLQIIAHDLHDPDTQEQLLGHYSYVAALKKAGGVRVTSLTPENYETAEALRDEFLKRLAEGPDILIFSGHGERSDLTKGKICFGDGVAISFAQHEHEFKEAIKQGLKVAIFISCHTYRFAHALVEIGLPHGIAMRDKIHVEAGGKFLRRLCECLSCHASLQKAMDHACEQLSQHKAKHPSAHLVPSRFRHPEADSFELPCFGLKQWWREWRPTRRESLAFASVFALSMVLPLQERLYNGRTAIQAVVRDVFTTAEHLIHPTTSVSPPVLVVAVDQDSVNEARNRFTDFNPNPMHRKYLAELVQQLTQAQATVVGIDYRFNDSTPHDKTLIESMQRSVQANQTKFVLAQDTYNNLPPLEKFAKLSTKPESTKLELTMSGDIIFMPWEVALPRRSPLDADILPFAHLLVLLKQVPSTPGAQTSQTLRQRLNQTLQSQSNLPEVKRLLQSQPPFGIESWIDFSLPPDQVYTQISAKDLKNQLTNDAFRKQVKDQIVMIIPGGYDKQDPSDLESVPLAMRYWCNLRSFFAWKGDRSLCRNGLNSDQFPLGKVHAYMAYQIQRGHFIYAPNSFYSFLFIVLAAVGAHWANLELAKVDRDRKRIYIRYILAGYLTYVVFALLLYLAPGVALPIALPSLLFGFNLFPAIQPLLTPQRTYVEPSCTEENTPNSNQA